MALTYVGGAGCAQITLPKDNHLFWQVIRIWPSPMPARATTAWLISLLSSSQLRNAVPRRYLNYPRYWNSITMAVQCCAQGHLPCHEGSASAMK